MKICITGATGAFGTKHLDALEVIEEAEVISIVDVEPDRLAQLATSRNIAHYATDLAESLKNPDIEAVILATPTPLHAAQAMQCLNAGKHVLVEIPMADNLADAEELVRLANETKRVAMVGHVRRFNPSHQWIHNRIQSGDLTLQHLDVQTYFFRRTNLNALGEPRSWTDHLLWHHACHTVDLFQYQTGATATDAYALQGPIHSELGIAMDMNIGLKAPSGALCSLSLSFNNDGPLGTTFRYICDQGTFIASYDDLEDGEGNPVDLSDVAVSSNGVELEDREFIAAIQENREPKSSLNQTLPTMNTLNRLAEYLNI